MNHRTSITVSSYRQLCCGTFMSSLLVRMWHWLKTALSHLAHAALLSVLPPVFPTPNLLIELLDYKRRAHIKQIVRLYPPLCNRQRLLGNGLVVPVIGIKYGEVMYMRKESLGLCVCLWYVYFKLGSKSDIFSFQIPLSACCLRLFIRDLLSIHVSFEQNCFFRSHLIELWYRLPFFIWIFR